MHAPEEDVAKYKGSYDCGYAPIREARYRKAIAQGVLDKKWPMSRGAVDWEKFPHKAWDIRCMEVYAAMVSQMDRGIGRIVSELKRQKSGIEGQVSGGLRQWRAPPKRAKRLLVDLTWFSAVWSFDPIFNSGLPCEAIADEVEDV